MKKFGFGGLISVFAVLLALPVSARTTTSLIYVSNEFGSSIDVIDVATNKVVQRIQGIGVPDGVISSPDGRRAYVPDQYDDSLDVIDSRTGTITQKVPLSGIPNLPAVSKDGKRIFVAIWALKSQASVRGAVDVVDASTLERIKTIPLNGPVHDVFTTPDSKYLIVGSSADKTMTAIDLQTYEVLWTIQFDQHGLRPYKTAGSVLSFAIESHPDGSTSRIFTELGGLNGFAVVDFATHKEVGRVLFPDEPIGYFNQPAHGIGISPDGKSLVVCGRGTNKVYVYSLPDLKLRGHVDIPQFKTPTPLGRGGDPHWVAFSPDSKTVYIPLCTLDAVSAIDVQSVKQVAMIPVGREPRHVALVNVPGSLKLINAAATSPSESLAERFMAQMPPGQGKTLVVEHCQWCHSLQRIVISHRTKDEWTTLVNTMYGLGSTITPLMPSKDIPVVIEYLSASFGPVKSTTSQVTDSAHPFLAAKSSNDSSGTKP